MAPMAAGSSYKDENSKALQDEMAAEAEAEYLDAMAEEDGWYDEWDSDDWDSDEGYPDLDSMDDDLAKELDGEQSGAMLLDSRTMCACRHYCL